METIRPLDVLKGEFHRRRTVNPAYSMRAFARFLQIQPGRLSEILSAKRPLTPRMATHIADRLALPPEQKGQLLSTLREERSLRKMSRFIKAPVGRFHYSQMESDAFHLISDWFHFAILSLLKTQDAKHDVKWIAQRLNLATLDVREALERLERLGFLERVGDRLEVREPHMSYDVSSAALRRLHAQKLQMAQKALEDIDPELRDITSVILTMSREKMGLAKQLIRQFRLNFAEALEVEPTSDVYSLSIQLIPLTRNPPASQQGDSNVL